MFNQTSFYIGVDMNDSEIKFVEISKKNNQFYLENYAIFSRQSDWKNQITLIPFKKLKLILSLSDSQVLSQIFQISNKLSHKEKREYLLLEMQKKALCEASELYMDFKILSDQTVFCVAVRRRTVDALIHVFHDTPFKVEKIFLTSECDDISTQSMSLSINSKLDESEWEKNKLLYQKAIQLAITEFNKKDVTLNFIPKQEEKNRNKKILLLGALLIILLWTFLTNFYQETKKSKKIVEHQKHKIIKKITPKHLGEYTLENTKINEFTMTGFLKKDNNVFGLIQTPDKKVYFIKDGDCIGLEKACIKKINYHKIFLIKKGMKYEIGF